MRKSFSILISLTLLGSGVICYAQKLAIGIRGGVSIPNLSGVGSDQTPLNTGYKSRLGSDLAIFAEYKMSDLFSLQPMIEYSAQGGQKKGLQAFPNPQSVPTYLYADFKSVAKLNYLMVPILAKFGWNFKNAPVRFYVSGGPFVSFLLSAKQVTTGESPIYLDAGGQQPISPPQSFNNTQDIKSQTNPTNFGFEANAGFAYRKGSNNFFIEGGGNYGLINIQKGSQNGKNNAGAGTIVVGISRWLHH